MVLKKLPTRLIIQHLTKTTWWLRCSWYGRKRRESWRILDGMLWSWWEDAANRSLRTWRHVAPSKPTHWNFHWSASRIVATCDSKKAPPRGLRIPLGHRFPSSIPPEFNHVQPCEKTCFITWGYTERGASCLSRPSLKRNTQGSGVYKKYGEKLPALMCHQSMRRWHDSYQCLYWHQNTASRHISTLER